MAVLLTSSCPPEPFLLSSRALRLAFLFLFMEGNTGRGPRGVHGVTSGPAPHGAGVETLPLLEDSPSLGTEVKRASEAAEAEAMIEACDRA